MMEKYEYGDQDASVVLIQMVDDHDLEGIENEVELIRNNVSSGFKLIALKVDNWNNDLSPWKAPAVFGKEEFGGAAASTLDEVMKLCNDESKTYYIGGYSLAGRGIRCTLEWNQGNHFKDADIRTAKAFIWVVQGNMERNYV